VPIDRIVVAHGLLLIQRCMSGTVRGFRFPVLPFAGWGVVVVALLATTTCRLEQLVIHPQGALLCVSPSLPDTLADSAAAGSGVRRSDAISIENCGGGELRWTAAVQRGSAWLAVQPDSGAVGVGQVDPQVTFDPAALPAGTYRETIVVNSTTGNGVALVPVRFDVHPCRVTPLTIGDSAVATLTPADCGAPHRPGHYARLFTFPGTANDSVSIEVAASYDAYVALDTAVAPGSAPLAESLQCIDVPGVACLFYERLPRNLSYVVEVSSANSGDSGLFALHLVHPRLPDAPQSLDQRLPDSVTSVSPGATVGQTSLLLRAALTDPDLVDSLHLEAEVRPVTVGFTGPNVPDGPAAGNGQTAWVSVAGLSDKTSYHWRVRAGDNTGRSGPWAAPGGNPDFVVNVSHPPLAPTALGQARGDGTGILTGAVTDTNVVILSGVVSDPDPGDLLRLDVEVRPVGTGFSGPTHSSPVAQDGGQMQAVVGPLPGGTSYHWRARAMDQSGDTSAWVSYGGNAESATDFGVAGTNRPDPPTALAQLQSGDGSPIPVGGTATASTVVLSGVVSEPNAGRKVLLDVEIAPVGQPFTGQPTASSPLGPSGGTATVTVGPVSENVGYHWQAQTRDDQGRTSGWVAFPAAPGNPETDPDFTYRVLPPPVRLVFTVQPTSTRVRMPISPPVVVTAQDANGQTDTGFSGIVTMTLGTNLTGARLSGTTSVAAVAGVATFSNLAIDKPGFLYTLRATTVQPPLSAVSASFNITRK
jgi:hypothetical protein